MIAQKAQKNKLWKGMGACMSKSKKSNETNPVVEFFSSIGKFFREFGEAVAHGDAAVKEIGRAHV